VLQAVEQAQLALERSKLELLQARQRYGPCCSQSYHIPGTTSHVHDNARNVYEAHEALYERLWCAGGRSHCSRSQSRTPQRRRRYHS